MVPSHPGLGAPRFLGLLGIAALFGCQTVPTGPGAPVPPNARVGVVFTEQDHQADKCLKALAASLEEIPDGVLFYDRDSRIRITPPRGKGIEPYHVHVRHQVGGEKLDRVLYQDAKGILEVDLGRFDAPETLIVTSSAMVFRDRAAERPSARKVSRSPDPVLAPYSMSFRLVPSEQVEVLTSLQPFRYEVASPLGKLLVFVQSFNRRDFLLSWIDPARKLDALIGEDPYVHCRPLDGVIPPRLTVEVLDAATGKAWQRAGTWHLPEGTARSEDPREKPFVLRTPRQDLVSFNPPPGVDLEVPPGPAGTSARIAARFSGLGEKDHLRLTLAARVPGPYNLDYSVRVQSLEVAPGDRETACVVGLNPDDPYPLTATLIHRFTQPWRMTGGMYRPEPPLGEGRVGLEPEGPGSLPRMPKRLVAPKYASHYDWILFLGDGKDLSGRESSPTERYHEGESPEEGPSPNMPPPPNDLPAGGVPLAVPPVPGPAGWDLPLTGAGIGGGAGGDEGKDQKEVIPQPGSIIIRRRCPWAPKTCGEDPAHCKCPAHLWHMGDLMAAMAPSFPGAADLSWFGPQTDSTPCCKGPYSAGYLRVSRWEANFQLKHDFYQVAVEFGPCVKMQGRTPPPDDVRGGGEKERGHGDEHRPKPPVPPEPLPDTPTVTIRDTSSEEELKIPAILGGTLAPAISAPQADPNLGALISRIASSLGLPVQRGATYVLPIEILNPALLTLALEIKKKDEENFLGAYYSHAPSTLEGLMDLMTAPPNFALFVPGIVPPIPGSPSIIPPGPPHCGALGIEFLAVLWPLRRFIRHRRGR